MRESLTNFMHDAKVGAGTAATTIGAGIGTALDWIPNDIGKLATLVGIILSVVLIWNHWRKGKNEDRKNCLEIELLRLQLERERLNDAPRACHPFKPPNA